MKKIFFVVMALGILMSVSIVSADPECVQDGNLPVSYLQASISGQVINGVFYESGFIQYSFHGDSCSGEPYALLFCTQMEACSQIPLV